MDWIERWFGVAPDNGDGSLELLLILCFAAGVVIAIPLLNKRARSLLLRVLHARATPRETRS
jgi:hypothetical protein